MNNQRRSWSRSQTKPQPNVEVHQVCTAAQVRAENNRGARQDSVRPDALSDMQANHHRVIWNLLLLTIRRRPQNLSFHHVELQLVGPHPWSDDLCRQRTHIQHFEAVQYYLNYRSHRSGCRRHRDVAVTHVSLLAQVDMQHMAGKGSDQGPTLLGHQTCTAAGVDYVDPQRMHWRGLPRYDANQLLKGSRIPYHTSKQIRFM